MSSLLYKRSGELGTGMDILAGQLDLGKAYLRKKRTESVANVKELNGRLRLEQIATRAQKQRDGDDESKLEHYTEKTSGPKSTPQPLSRFFPLR